VSRLKFIYEKNISYMNYFLDIPARFWSPSILRTAFIRRLKLTGGTKDNESHACGIADSCTGRFPYETDALMEMIT
jgi:hypothetical protein